MEKIIQKIPKRFKSRKTMFGENFWGILMASVPLIGAFFFMLIPLVFSLILSFCSMKGFDPASIEFLGAKHLFDNYVYIFKEIGGKHLLRRSFPASVHGDRAGAFGGHEFRAERQDDFQDDLLFALCLFGRRPHEYVEADAGHELRDFKRVSRDFRRR